MDEEGFVSQVESLGDTLYRVCRTILRSDADCQDAVQEALLKAWRHIRDLRDDSLFDRWLIRITVNECKKLLKKRRVYEPLNENITAGSQDDSLWPIIHTLDVKYRVVVELYYVEQYKTKEIAQIMGIPEGTVKRRLHTARNQLKEVQWQ